MATAASLAIARPSGNWLRLIYLCAAGVFAWGAWPSSMWLGLSLLIAIVLRLNAERTSRLAGGTAKRVMQAAVALTCRNLAKAALCVAIGIALVCTAQIALSIATNVSEDTLRGSEILVSDVRSHLHHLVGF